MDVGNDALARLEAVEAAVFGRRYVVDAPTVVEHVDLLEPVPLADLEVVEVVRRRDLHRAGALLGIGIFVGE